MNNCISKGRRCLLTKWKVHGSLEQTEITSTGGNKDNLGVKIVFKPFQPFSVLASRAPPWKSSQLWGICSFDAVCIGDDGSGGKDKGREDGRWTMTLWLLSSRSHLGGSGGSSHFC